MATAKISKRITADGYLDLGWSSKEILKTREARLERARIARRDSTQAAMDAVEAAEETAQAVQEDRSIAGSRDRSQRTTKRNKGRAAEDEQTDGREQDLPPDSEPVKMAFKPSRMCLLIQGIPTPDKWLASLGIPLFQPQHDEATLRAAEEPTYKEAYLAHVGGKGPGANGDGSHHSRKQGAPHHNAPLPGWVEVVRPLEPQTTLNLSRANGGSGHINDEQLLARVALSVGTLTVLDITGCKLVTPVTVFTIAKANPHLAVIRASDGMGWTSSLVHQVVRTLPELESLTTDLTCIKIDDYLMQLLDHPLVKVRSLTFTRNIELHDLQRFAPVLMQAKIETFDIKNCKIGPKGFFAIATALEMNTSITSLNLRKCDLGPLAGAKVGQMLRGNTAITTLNVSVNNIRSEGCREICKAMCAGRGNNDRVHTLNLACNAIDAEGVDALEELLMDNRTIRILDLTDNDLGPKGKKVCAALKNSSITQVFLAGNRMGDKAGKELLNTLKTNAEIWKITFYNNELSKRINDDLSIETLESLLDRDAEEVENAVTASSHFNYPAYGGGDEEEEEEEEEGEEGGDEEADEEEGSRQSGSRRR